MPKACLYLLLCAAPLLLLTVTSFSATIILGAIGIHRAGNSNPCVNNNGTSSCTVQVTLNTVINGTEDPVPIVDIPDPNEFKYWLAGATGCSVLFALVAPFSLWVLEDALRRIKKLHKHQADIELEERRENTDAPQANSPAPEKKHVDTIGNHNIFEKLPSKLRKLNACAILGLFMSCLLFILAVVCILWAIAIAFVHSRQEERTVTSFVIVELLVGIAFPFLSFASGIIMAIVVDFVTFGEADARTALPYFLHSVKFKKGDKYDYWVIVDSFYFQLTKRTEDARKKHGLLYSCYPNLATWILVGIVSLSVNLAVSFLGDRILDTQVSVTSCGDDRIDRTYNCFNSSSLAYVDCVENTNVELIHCFKFNRFGVDTDLIQALSTAFAFYLFASAIFGHLFLVMKIFLHISQRRIWGVLLIIAGVGLFLVSCALIVIWLTGYISPAQPEWLAQLNIINLSQIVMVSFFVTLVGLLIVTGTWVEKCKKKQD